ncbi:hypothetical protein FH972_022215 [Carpinus fangiana]|uniref:Uncharacterized protein n=1 Tax=Carpinus fangiana TaxID=176857 RepID=A0A5N6KRL2_9ROSI|nr:hypothetical protein FH972_022215 [Carpinus fangiana]
MEPFPTVGEATYDDLTRDSSTTAHLDTTPTVRRRSATTISTAGSSHKRTTSGSVLSRFKSLRIANDDRKSDSTDPFKRRNSKKVTAKDEHGADLRTEQPGSDGLAQSDVHLRRRKSSLRKTAILGPSKTSLEERKAPNTVDPPSRWSSWLHPEAKDRKPSGAVLPHLDIKELNIEVPEPAHHTTNRTSTQLLSPDYFPPSRGSPVTSPVGAYASTTDDDEGLTLPIFSATTIPRPTPSPSPSSSESSATGLHALQHRRSAARLKSPLAAVPHAEYAAIDDEWDYAATERWGWAILAVTWAVFVVGMGSCFEVWSWAWDVGQTPYAPPELEDDPTLPIVGYYPALMVLTGVVSWIWVVVAWVGMKYFKHAKMVGEDT